MDLGLKDKVAFITGAGSQAGMGKAIALALAGEGCDIIVADIDIEGAEKTASNIRSLGRKALVVKGDITKIDDVNEMVKNGLEEFNKIDILVNKTREEVASKYVTKEEFAQSIDRVIDRLDKLDEKMDRLITG